MNVEEFARLFSNKKVTLKNYIDTQELMTDMQFVMLEKYRRSKGPGYVNGTMLEALNAIIPANQLTIAQADAILTILGQREASRAQG